MLAGTFRKAFSSLTTGLDLISKRTWSQVSQAMAKTLTFTELNNKLKVQDTILLDVREPNELKTDGMISGARNIPVGDFPAAISMTAEDFKLKYGFPKPQPSDDIVIHCKAGVRAQNAAKVLVGAGYSKVEVYPGILDWIENGGPVQK